MASYRLLSFMSTSKYILLVGSTIYISLQTPKFHWSWNLSMNEYLLRIGVTREFFLASMVYISTVSHFVRRGWVLTSRLRLRTIIERRTIPSTTQKHRLDVNDRQGGLSLDHTTPPQLAYAPPRAICDWIVHRIIHFCFLMADNFQSNNSFVDLNRLSSW